MATKTTKREPQVELRKLTDDYCEFVLKGTDVSMANALRRIILVEVRGGGTERAAQRALHVALPPPAPCACLPPCCRARHHPLHPLAPDLHPLFSSAPRNRCALPRCHPAARRAAIERRCPPLPSSWLSLRPTPRC